MPPRNVYLLFTIALICFVCHSKAERLKNAAPLGEAISLIDRYYIEPVDERELLNAAMAGLTVKLDPYTQFIPPGAYETFQNTIEQQFAGIGILVDQLKSDQPVRVITPLVGSPALTAGFLPNDQIIAVQGQSVISSTINDVTKLLRGPEGSEVVVRVRRNDAAGAVKELDIAVKRANIELESVAGDYRDQQNRWVYHLADHPDIAYIRLTGFGEKTSRELSQVLNDLSGSYRGLILDLRGNSGGLLRSAVDVCDMFLETGRVVSTRSRETLRRLARSRLMKQEGISDDEVWDATPGVLVPEDIPLVVLIDSESASAAEIVAACLSDHKRAAIVGERSFGKGSVQNIFALENGRSALKLTTAQYLRPNGKNIHRKSSDKEDDEWGVQPDAGNAIALNEQQQRMLIRKWELATYPNLPGLADVVAQATPATAVEAVVGGAEEGSDAEVKGDERVEEPEDPQLEKALAILSKSTTE